jgi:hypothetical protein
MRVENEKNNEWGNDTSDFMMETLGCIPTTLTLLIMYEPFEAIKKVTDNVQ